MMYLFKSLQIYIVDNVETYLTDLKLKQIVIILTRFKHCEFDFDKI